MFLVRRVFDIVLSAGVTSFAMGMALELGEESRQPLSQRNGPMCVLFSGPNQTGDALHLPLGHAHASLSQVYTARRSWHGHFRGWSGRDITWSNAVHSAAVSKGAWLFLYVDEGFSELGGYIQMRDSQVSNFGPYNGRFKSVRCVETDSSLNPRVNESQKSRWERYSMPQNHWGFYSKSDPRFIK